MCGEISKGSATVTRYPGDYEPISVAEAREAVKIARRVQREARKLLADKPLSNFLGPKRLFGSEISLFTIDAKNSGFFHFSYQHFVSLNRFTK